MKTRITLTIDPKISFKAKTVASEKGTSLSALVEELLASVSGMEIPDETIAVSEKWRGKEQLRTGVLRAWGFPILKMPCRSPPPFCLEPGFL